MAFIIIRDDIAKVQADVIVNTANPEPTYGSGTDAAIYRAAGTEQLMAARKKIGKIAVGEAKATKAFGLKAKYIIHTVGPVWQGGRNGEKEAVRACYENSLELAEKKRCRSIAFPLIATGTYGFPKDEALQIAVDVFRTYLQNKEMEIYLVVYDRESFVLSGDFYSGIDEYIDENYIEQIHEIYGRAPESSVSRQLFGAPGTFLEEAADASSESTIPQEQMDVPMSAPASSEAKATGRPDFAPASPASFRAPVQQGTGSSSLAPSERSKGKKKDIFHEMFRGKSSSRGQADRSLEDVIAQVSETFQQSLFRLIDEKGYKDTEVYKKANVDRKHFSKIRSNVDYQPKKNTAVSFALALELNMDETRDLLARAGFALSPSSKFDVIISYCIEHEVYDIYAINLALFEHDQPLLG